MNTRFKTFIKVADSGSFNKAAESLYISAPAVIKQINSLEKEIDIELFKRTNQGLTLTEAGKSFYDDVKHLLNYFDNAVKKAKFVEYREKGFLRIGVSVMTPVQCILELWPQIYKYQPDIKFQIIPFENKPEIAREGEMNFERDIDLTVGMIDYDFLAGRGCSATYLFDEPIRIAVPKQHRLHEKDKLNLQDLYGENLMIIKENWNASIDKLRDYLKKNCPQINIITFDFYSVEVYNQCVGENNLILTIDYWKNVHPFMKVIPVKWKYAVPFGILHAKNPSERVQRFLGAIKYTVKDSKIK